MSRILDWVSLSLVPGLGDVGVRSLVSYFGGADKVLLASRKDLINGAGLRADVADRLVHSDTVLRRGEKELTKLERFGGRAVCLDDEHYPQLLKQINRPPVVLYTVGKQELLDCCCVAIVGSRAATVYGQRTSYNLARDLAGRSVAVVSGLALGIDAEAHAGSLAVSGPTVAVLGCGLDVVYPYQNRKLYERMKTDGVLVSEYPLNTRPDGFRFPARNRIIAGLSQGVVIVEAARKSGSLITAGLALEEGREIFAVPGRIDSFKSAGTHWLLQQGAKLVQGVDDILEELNPGISMGIGHTVEPQNQTAPAPDTDGFVLLSSLDAYPIKRDELIHKSSFSAARVNELLLFLELEGLIEMLPGDEIRKIIT